jgi:hypothetical protein
MRQEARPAHNALMTQPLANDDEAWVACQHAVVYHKVGVPSGQFCRVHDTYHKFIPLPVINPALMLEAGDSQGEPHSDGTVMHRHEVHELHKDGQHRGPFLHRVHHELMLPVLGPWEGCIVPCCSHTFPLTVALGPHMMCLGPNPLPKTTRHLDPVQ